MLGRRRAATTDTPVADHLAPWHLGAVHGHDRHHGHARVGQDLGGLVGFEVRRPEGGGEGVAAMAQPPGRVELEPAPVPLGVDDQDAAGADGQVDALMAVKASVPDGLGGLGSWS
jgi:hypothetical protein